MARSLRLPGPNQRQLIIGKTGSGKTMGALYQLSLRDFDAKPWYILDTKHDENIAQIDGAHLRDIEDPISDYPGIYIVRTNPGDEKLIEDFLWRLWEHQDVGLFIDEAYSVGDTAALRAILTQGRSKNIPAIILAQRPSWISRFAISEAEFFQIYRVIDKRDQDKLYEFIPRDAVDVGKRLDAYHSWYYDADAEDVAELGPAPIDEIQPRFAARLREINNELDPPDDDENGGDDGDEKAQVSFVRI